MNAAYQYAEECYQADLEQPDYPLISDKAFVALWKEQAAHEETRLKLVAWRVYFAVAVLCLIGQSINIVLGVV